MRLGVENLGEVSDGSLRYTRNLIFGYRAKLDRNPLAPPLSLYPLYTVYIHKQNMFIS